MEADARTRTRLPSAARCIAAAAPRLPPPRRPPPRATNCARSAARRAAGRRQPAADGGLCGRRRVRRAAGHRRTRRGDAGRVPVQPVDVGADRADQRAAPIIAAELGRRRACGARGAARRSAWRCGWRCVACAAVRRWCWRMAKRCCCWPGRTRGRARDGRFLDILLFALVPGVLAGVMRTDRRRAGRARGGRSR